LLLRTGRKRNSLGEGEKGRLIRLVFEGPRIGKYKLPSTLSGYCRATSYLIFDSVIIPRPFLYSDYTASPKHGNSRSKSGSSLPATNRSLLIITPSPQIPSQPPTAHDFRHNRIYSVLRSPQFNHVHFKSYYKSMKSTKKNKLHDTLARHSATTYALSVYKSSILTIEIFLPMSPCY
jgi:hypothetical protein